jgi:thymidylate kinase
MAFDLPFKMKPGHLIVFEGFNDTGKSTQLERFEQMCYHPDEGNPKFYEPVPMFTHQPSGASGIGPDIYELTESVDWSVAHPLTRQLLHLAAHNEHYVHDLIPALKERSVFMDRCWWSTFAYGWGPSLHKMMSKQHYLELCQMPARLIAPTVVFLFTHKHREAKPQDEEGRQVMRNYLWLQDRYRAVTALVPDVGPGEVLAFISGELVKRGLVDTG